jgi:hypothetical protein
MHLVIAQGQLTDEELAALTVVISDRLAGWRRSASAPARTGEGARVAAHWAGPVGARYRDPRSWRTPQAAGPA